jgi:hypothetical protein
MKSEKSAKLLREKNDLLNKISTLSQAIAFDITKAESQFALGQAMGLGDTIAPELLKTVLPSIQHLRGFLNKVEKQILSVT